MTLSASSSVCRWRAIVLLAIFTAMGAAALLLLRWPPATESRVTGEHGPSASAAARPAASQPEPGLIPPLDALLAPEHPQAPTSDTPASSTAANMPAAKMGLPFAPLEHEPARLTPYPGATHQARFRRHAQGVVEEVSTWRVAAGEVEAVAEHYREQARRQGFEPLQAHGPGRAASKTHETGEARAAHRLRFHRRPTEPAERAEQGEQWLIVRLSRRHEIVHVMIWLQYPMGSEEG